ncbi:MAG TPA: hypothetical protein VMD03_10445 [Steroidobacteraceae bacterium]|nr:hypothetical protein [Steroidobacteraceae bacterium]
MAKLRARVEDLGEAIATGGLKGSPTLARKLAEAEAELEQLLVQAQASRLPPVANVTRLLADLPITARRAVDELERTLAAGDLPRARARDEIRRQVGEIRVEAGPREIKLFRDGGRLAATLLRAAGCDARSVGSGGRI